MVLPCSHLSQDTAKDTVTKEFSGIVWKHAYYLSGSVEAGASLGSQGVLGLSSIPTGLMQTPGLVSLFPGIF